MIISTKNYLKIYFEFLKFGFAIEIRKNGRQATSTLQA